MEMTSYEVEWIRDPFGILAGKRYEFRIDLDVDAEDDLYTPNGVYVRAVYRVEDEQGKLVTYDLVEKGTDRLLEFDLEEDEELELAAFCAAHWQDAEQ
ncbi:DUF6509 family protein [Paenibacillus campi]|uniref:DUF6509 family protein n=1 Tax=Paenibacillus campi TaxID=3106031 RepID=UPI002AFF6493|nr:MULTISPECIES: DUF6509 family protein [unclassified Paenibacillus]